MLSASVALLEETVLVGWSVTTVTSYLLGFFFLTVDDGVAFVWSGAIRFLSSDFLVSICFGFSGSI